MRTGTYKRHKATASRRLYAPDENNDGIIGCLQVAIIKELSGTKVAECNEISQASN